MCNFAPETPMGERIYYCDEGLMNCFVCNGRENCSYYRIKSNFQININKVNTLKELVDSDNFTGIIRGNNTDIKFK